MKIIIDNKELKNKDSLKDILKEICNNKHFDVYCYKTNKNYFFQIFFNKNEYLLQCLEKYKKLEFNTLELSIDKMIEMILAYETGVDELEKTVSWKITHYKDNDISNSIFYSFYKKHNKKTVERYLTISLVFFLLIPIGIFTLIKLNLDHTKYIYYLFIVVGIPGSILSFLHNQWMRLYNKKHKIKFFINIDYYKIYMLCFMQIFFVIFGFYGILTK